MDIVNIIESSKPGDWIDCLPNYQQKPIKEWYSISRDYNIVADNWQQTTYEMYAPCGNLPSPKNYYEQVLNELEALLRGADRYKDLLSKIDNSKIIANTAISTWIANSIAEYTGTSSVFIAPLVMLALETIAKLGVNAWLNTRKKMNNPN